MFQDVEVFSSRFQVPIASHVRSGATGEWEVFVRGQAHMPWPAWAKSCISSIRIREDLLASTDHFGTIAYWCGISHLGRFADAYRHRFHELPSDTAARR